MRVAAACAGEEKGGEDGALRVCYLRHAYGLGEHYNSVIPAEEEEEDYESNWARGQALSRVLC